MCKNNIENVSYIEDFKKIIYKPRPNELENSINDIFDDSLLAWHFLNKLQDPIWFLKVEKYFDKIIINKNNDSLKYKLIEYLSFCTKNYSDSILNLLNKIYLNTQNSNLIQLILRVIINLELNSSNINIVCELLYNISNFWHPFVKNELLETLKNFIVKKHPERIDIVFKILKNIFYSSEKSDNITTWSPSMSLMFQWYDLDNSVFWEASDILWCLIGNVDTSEKAIKFSCELLPDLFSSILCKTSNNENWKCKKKGKILHGENI